MTKVKDTLLLVGDGASERKELRALFEDSYNLLEAENTAQALLLLEQNYDCVATVLADIPPAGKDALCALVSACHIDSENEIPLVAFITPGDNDELEGKVFLLGASEVISRPYSPSNVKHRVDVIVDLFRHRWQLENMLEDQNEAIRNANQDILDALSSIIEYRNVESGNHIMRIRRFTKILMEEIALYCPEYQLTSTNIDTCASVSALHDIGKISIPDRILNKPGKLTADEFEIMKTHTTTGSHMIQQLGRAADAYFLQCANDICLYHHERWDGRGYPSGLKGDDIPISAQAVGLADAFDALTTPRVYKEAFSCEKSFEMIISGECGIFSPKLLECFKHVRHSFFEVAEQYADGYSPKNDMIRVPATKPAHGRHAVDTFQLSFAKYQTLLHYTNDTIVEVNLESKTYHVAYNPNPDLQIFLSNDSLENLMVRVLKGRIHPDDRDIVDEIGKLIFSGAIQYNDYRYSLHCHIYSSTQSEYQPYTVTMLRVDTDKESMEQPILLVIFHKEKQDSPVSASAVKAIPMDSTILRAMSIPIRCQCNDTLTIVSGEDALVSLSGYSVEEIESYFHRSLLEMIVPQDRTIFSSSLSASSGEDVITTAEYRLLRKNRKPVWVLGKSFVQTEENGTSHIYHTITDITLLKDREGQIESASMRNQFILEQSGSVVFEWDLVRDTMFYTDRFKEIFEYCPDSNHFTEYLSHSTHFHPDDLPLILKVVRDVDGGKHSIDINARILSNRGTYLWTRIFATALFDEQGKPTRIIGTVTDIDSMMKQNLSIKEQADRDSLTKLLNKASTQRIITSYLSQRSPEETACLLILDLDNFKAVNDSYGHMYGDALLSKVGNTLQRLFRSNDIIGRIGGDEFLILLRNLPNQKAVESRCDLVLRSFRELMSRMMPDLDGSCSIGIALIPEHGTAYSELYQHADQALYSAKLNGKNQYKIYDPLYEYELLRTGSSHITHIDSDTDQHLSEDGFVRLVFNRLYRSHNIRSTIDELLAFIGTLFNVSRVYIFENSQDNSACSNTFEWCNEGIHPQKDFLQNLTYAGDLPGWQALYDENGLFYCTDITTLSPPLRSILEPQDIKSTLQYAILDNGIFSGFIGFDECSSNRLWTQEQISLLEFLSEVISIFLIKHPPQDEDEDLEA